MCKSEKNTEPIKNRKLFDKILTTVLVIMLVLAFGWLGVIIYQKKYLTPFWVNGQSMYPTFNKDTAYFDGKLYGVYGGAVSGDGAKKVDYGVMDEHDRAKRKIKRFDIVICRYSDTDSSDKIKRVIGLPGETIKFDNSNTVNRGELSVKQTDGTYKIIDQPIDKQYINSFAAYYPSEEIVLKDNEYFVCGDNRAHSNDSRGSSSNSWSPITYDWIKGKVVAIVGTCEAYKVSTGYDIRNVDYFKWPRFIK